MKKFTTYYLLLATAFIGLFFFSFNQVFAEDPPPPPVEYKLLAPVPFVETALESGKTNVNLYIPGIIRLAIAVAGGLAVLMIMVGGAKYMTSDAWGERSDAKDTIKNAFWGLFMALTAWIILFTINPRLVEIDLKIEGQRVGTDFEVKLPQSEITAMGCTNNCVTAPLIAPYGRPGSACKPGPACLINADLKERIDRIPPRINTRAGVFVWGVTEMFPPKASHISSCHTAGSCVDMAIRRDSSGRLLDPIKVVTFMVLIQEKIGNNFIYEVPNEARRKQIADFLSFLDKGEKGNYSRLIGKIKTKNEIKSRQFTGEHAHVRYP